MADPAPPTFSALILAGTRPGGDPMAHAAGVAHKALIPIAGVAMLARVVRALRSTRCVGRIHVCGVDAATLRSDAELSGLAARQAIELIDGGPTPSSSVLRALDEIDRPFPLLVTTADHPLLTPAIVEAFCTAADDAGADVAIGLVPAARVQAAFPGSRRTFLRLRDGAYCGCNLFAFLTADARRAAAAWREIEQHRKRPWRMVRALGPTVLLRFLLGRLALDDVVALASERMGVQVRVVSVTDPNAAVDVDNPADLALVERLLRTREGTPPC